MHLKSLSLFWLCYCLLKSVLKPFGYNVSNFRIQKFYLLVSHQVRVFLNLELFVSWSITVNFAYLLKLRLSCWKCLQAIIASTLFTSFEWLFSLILKLIPAFPTFCLLHKMPSIKYITYLLAQLTLWNILYIFFVCWLLIAAVSRTCLQQSDLKFFKHRKYFPGFSFRICLPISIPLFCLNAVTHWQSNITFKDSFIAGKLQYFFITLLMFG